MHPGGVRTAMALFFFAKCHLRNILCGIFQIVSGGGHIEYWVPIYDSEGPHQVAFILIKYLQLKLRGKTEEERKQFFLSYDHMCGVDRLKLLRQPLPFEPPDDRIWLDLRKLIDPLHLKNHQNKRCQELYNPEVLKNHVPDGNLMCAVTDLEKVTKEGQIV